MSNMDIEKKGDKKGWIKFILMLLYFDLLTKHILKDGLNVKINQYYNGYFYLSFDDRL